MADSSVDDVNTSILYTAARFNAFSAARLFESVEKMKAEKKEAIKFFTQRYKEMLVQNIDEYISLVESYSQK